MKKISKRKIILLIIVALIVLTFFIIIFRIYKYHKIEKDYVSAAMYIYNKNGIENVKNISKIVLTRNEINFLLDDSPLNNKCNGYVIITNNKGKPIYKAYITCKEYTTKDFERSFLD